MHKTLSLLSIVFSLGIFVSLLCSTEGWADSAGFTPAERAMGPDGSAWSPWHYRRQSGRALRRSEGRHFRHGHIRPGYLIVPGRAIGPPMAYGGAPFARPGYGPPPGGWFGYGPGPFATPGYPGRSRHRQLRGTPRQTASDAWAPDEGGDVYRSFTSPLASVDEGDPGREISVASGLESVPPAAEPVGDTPMPIPPTPAAEEPVVGEPHEIEATANVVREPHGSPAVPPLKVERTVVPSILEPQAEERAAPLPPMPQSEQIIGVAPEPQPSRATAAPVELGGPTSDGLSLGVEVSGQAARIPAEVESPRRTPPPAASVSATELEDDTEGEAVAKDAPAPAEEAPVTASGVSETRTAAEESQGQAAGQVAGEDTGAAEGKRKSLVERWLSPKPGAL